MSAFLAHSCCLIYSARRSFNAHDLVLRFAGRTLKLGHAVILLSTCLATVGEGSAKSELAMQFDKRTPPHLHAMTEGPSPASLVVIGLAALMVALAAVMILDWLD